MIRSQAQDNSMDVLGQLIKVTPGFRGKWRFIQQWMHKRDKAAKRIRILPGGGKVLCDLSVPYEAMVWLKHEEQKDLNILRHLLKSGQTFIDCGANIGIWTITAASAVEEDGKVYAFEPNPSTFEKPSKNIDLERLENIQLSCSALGAKIREEFLECHKAHNISQIVPKPSNESLLVSTRTLDSNLNSKPVHGIKIDVEGFELQVLKGSESILREYKPWLCIEFNTLLAKVNSLSAWNVHQYLNDQGYVCRQFKDALNTSVKTILPDSWQTNGYCNLYYSIN